MRSEWACAYAPFLTLASSDGDHPAARSLGAQFRPKSAILTTNDTAFAFIGQLKALHNHVRPQREKLTILTSHQGFSVSFQFPIGQFDNGVGFMPGGLALRFFAQKLESGIHVDLFA